MFTRIPVNQIVPSPHQARVAFDQESLDGLAASLKAQGQLQAILVRKAGDRFELISGERRWRAARMLGWTDLDANVIETADDSDAAAKGMVENIQREELNPIEEAKGFAELQRLDAVKWTQDKIAEMTGKDQTYISKSLGLLKLPDAIQENMRRRIFSWSHGVELCRLPTVALQNEVSAKIKDRLTAKETRRLVDSILKGQKPSKRDQKDVLEDDPLARQAMEALLAVNLELSMPNSWGVTYAGNRQWQFQVVMPGDEILGGIAEWSRGLADALQKGKKTPPRKAAQGARVYKESGPKQRLPKTDAERADYFKQAAKSPADMMRWVLGKNAPIPAHLNALSWAMMMTPNPRNAAEAYLRDPMGDDWMTTGKSK